ncbi:SAM-dependent methyltransferase [Nonomuraea longicatena]|uniref:SAM-dependent methyltransferase n=1 Tax=Nonomuraea longicatena TaxID=83682 RepID=A0ABN1R7I1_9ACTN
MSSDPADSRIDATVPHPARVWDYWLGGKDFYTPDRQVGDLILAVTPDLAVIARAEREFLGRVVRLAAESGIRQFLDVGTGIPSTENTHEVAQRAAPEARIVYVDNDPVVLAHARALLRGTPEGATAYLDADLRAPQAILEGAARTLDLGRPVCLMLLGILEFVPNLAQAYSAVRTLREALAPGSLLAVASSVRSPSMEAAAAVWNRRGGTPVTLRTSEEIAGFLSEMEPLSPGVVSLPQWRPEAATRYTDRDLYQYGGAAWKA